MKIANPNSSLNNLGVKILFTIAMVLLYRFGSYIPIPGVNPIVMKSVMDQNREGIMGMFNMLSGGSLGRMSIFALAIMPYITASIVIQLFSMSYKTLAEMKKSGEQGRKKMNQISRYLTLVIAGMHALGITSWLDTLDTPLGKVVMISSGLFKFIGVLSLIVGTMILMWLGEQITAKGIGNGSSIIIFVGIISELPSSIITSLELIRKGALSGGSYAIGALITAALMAFVVFCERALRKIRIHNPNNHARQSLLDPESSFLPIKINIAGVIPPMFADIILRFPLTIAGLSGDPDSIFVSWTHWLNRGSPLFMLLYSGLIILFCFTYTAIVFNTEEMTKNMQKSHTTINGMRPGQLTRQYLDGVIMRVTSVGALYILTVCLLPEILSNVFNISIVGGTTLIIVVNVVMDTITQVQSYTMQTKYANISKRLKLAPQPQYPSSRKHHR